MDITLEPGDDHIERLAHESDPVRAIIELVWNSVDADADEVEIQFERNEADGVVGVSVRDDGHGMNPESIESAFRYVGNSWKRHAKGSIGGSRPLHGKFGQGRLRAFALGTNVSWITVGKDTTGKLRRSVVSSDVYRRTTFSISQAQDTDRHTGTEFHAHGRDGLGKLDSDEAFGKLSVAVTPYLLNHQTVEIKYDGRRVEPTDNIDRDQLLDLAWEHGGKTQSGQLRIIEWKNVTGRTLYLCDAAGVPVDEGPKPKAADFNYAAYVLWEEMPSHEGMVMLVHMEQETSALGALMKLVDAKLSEYFDNRRAEQRRELVESWKSNETYPYVGEPTSDEERVERATFDVVATTIRRQIPKARGQEKLTLGLLRDTLRRNPDGVATLLDQFVGLTAEEGAQLQRLLERTSLSRLISATTEVTDRLDFIAALKALVFEPEANDMVKEREHLHKILERESWVFGEEFNMMTSELGLTRALHHHLALLGRDTKNVTPVKTVDGKMGRLDLMLSVHAQEHDRIRHLVVELKAPSVTACDTEANQIKKYARAVLADQQFSDVRADWDFMLIVNDYNDEVRKDISQVGRQRGILDQSEVDPDSPVQYRVWVRKWSEVFDGIDKRLDYYKKGLEHDPSMDDIRTYLTDHHGDVLPEGLFDPAPEVGGGQSGSSGEVP